MRGTTDHELLLLSCFGVALAKSGNLVGKKQNIQNSHLQPHLLLSSVTAYPAHGIARGSGADPNWGKGRVAGLSQGHMDIKLAVAFTEFQSH